MITVLSKGLNYYVDRLATGQPFSFVRFGNGEWGCILRKMQGTPSGSQSFANPRLRSKLKEAVWHEHPTYLKGIQSPGYLKHAALWLSVERYVGDATFYAADVFHRASGSGNLYPLIEQLRKMSIGVIGPRHLRPLEDILDIDWFVTVKDTGCFDDFKAIRLAIALKPQVDVYSFSCGPAAKPLIRDLSVLFPDKYLIDFGSLWDVYCGVKSRGYHKKVDIQCNICPSQQ